MPTSNKTPDRSVLHRVTPPPVARRKGNGQRVDDEPLDPRIVKMVEFLDKAIRSQNVTVGVVVAAVGVLLGRKVLNHDHLERMVKDVSAAVRVGFFLSRVKKDN